MPIVQFNLQSQIQNNNFTKKIAVPEPTLCPQCRMQRRFAFRNERKLYRRRCDLTGKSIISFHHPDKDYTVYAHQEWWSDKWNALDYGCDFDFSRPFFEQFSELQKQVPRLSMQISHCENSDYAPYSVYSKNCYMCISCLESEDLIDCYQTNSSRDCIDCSLSLRCELCYECLYCVGLFQSAFCQNCEESSELYFCQDCKNCSNCIGCKNLVNKKYHVFNQPVSPEEFKNIRKSLGNYQEKEPLAQKAQEFFLTQPQRASYFINCENCTGDHLLNSKDSFWCFDSREMEDCVFAYIGPKEMKDCQDLHYSPNSELVYDTMSGVNNYATKWMLHSWDMKHSSYCDECFYSHHLFGCIGLKNQEYCILNKKYSKEEYEQLIPKIIGHMQVAGEWGEFFPIEISPFGYNETLAQHDFPLTKEEIFAKDWKWREEEIKIPKVEKIIAADKIPNSITDIPDDILSWAIRCAETDRPFKIQPMELDFYRKMHLPIPRLHPDVRYERRMKLRNPCRLYERNCIKTGETLLPV